MESKQFLAFTLVACSLFPCLSSLAVDVPETSVPDEFRDPRQLSFFSTPIRRAASSTRDVVKFIRDYSAFRLANATPPDPQTTVGKRAVQLLQHVTLDSVRDALYKLLNSEAAPVVANIVKNLDRDTLQLFNGPDRTYEGLVRRNASSTTVKPSTNSTRTRVRVKGRVNGTTVPTTVATLAVETSTTVKPVAVGGEVGTKTNIKYLSGDRKQVSNPQRVEEEDDSGEDDNDDD